MLRRLFCWEIEHVIKINKYIEFCLATQWIQFKLQFKHSSTKLLRAGARPLDGISGAPSWGAGRLAPAHLSSPGPEIHMISKAFWKMWTFPDLLELLFLLPLLPDDPLLPLRLGDGLLLPLLGLLLPLLGLLLPLLMLLRNHIEVVGSDINNNYRLLLKYTPRQWHSRGHVSSRQWHSREVISVSDIEELVIMSNPDNDKAVSHFGQDIGGWVQFLHTATEDWGGRTLIVIPLKNFGHPLFTWVSWVWLVNLDNITPLLTCMRGFSFSLHSCFSSCSWIHHHVNHLSAITNWKPAPPPWRAPPSSWAPWPAPAPTGSSLVHLHLNNQA